MENAMTTWRNRQPQLPDGTWVYTLLLMSPENAVVGRAHARALDRNEALRMRPEGWLRRDTRALKGVH